MNKSAYKSLAVIALLILVPTSSAFAQTESLPDGIGIDLKFLDPVTAGLTQLATSSAINAVQVIGALIILAIGYVVGKSVEKVSKRILDSLVKIGKEKLPEGVMGSDESIDNPQRLIPLSLKWFAYTIFIIASVNALGFVVLSNALSNLWLWIPNILASVIVLILGTILVRFIDKWILERKFFGTDETSGQGAKTIIKVVIYSAVIAIAVTQLGVGQEIIPQLVEAFSWGIAGAFALAVGLGLRQIIPDWVSGKDNERLGLTKGNHIEIPVEDGENVKGEVVDVGVTKIKIKLESGSYQLMSHSLFEDVVLTIKEQEEK